MPRTDLNITTPDGVCAASLHTPSGDGPWPAVILFPDAGGARDTFRAMADRLASLGYATLLPDVFYREAGYEPFDMNTVFSDAAERARILALVGTLTPERVVSDAGAFLDALAERPEVAPGGVGTTGYCMGGRISLLVAGHYPDRVAAAASFHGGGLAAADDPNSPHQFADRIRAQVYVAGAADDASFPQEQFDRLSDALKSGGVSHTVETYPALHGFAVPDNPPFDEAAAERHWAALAKLYADALG